MSGSRARHARFAVVAALALLVGSSPARSVGAAQTADRTTSSQFPSADRSGENEHDEDTSPEIQINWILPTQPVRVYAPVIELELLGLHVDTAMDIEVRTLEDAGTLQSRRVGEPVRRMLAAPYRLQVPVAFAERLPADMQHSGMFVAVVRACADGRCLTGTSAPLFFHDDEGGYLVYGEQALCRDFRCGDLRGGGLQERGTWRVMGGGPLHAVPSREEPDDEDERVVEGGDV